MTAFEIFDTVINIGIIVVDIAIITLLVKRWKK